MNSTSILILYLVFFTVHFLWELFLDILNIGYVEQHRGRIPEMFSGHIDDETYEKSVDYTLTKAKFGIVNLFYSSLLLLIFILSGLFGSFDGYVGSLGLGSYTTGIIYVFLLSLVFSVLEMPFSLYSTFVIEERFGFNKMTWKLWIVDTLKSLLISVILLTPLLYGLFWFMDAAGKRWWIYAFLFVALFQLFVMYVYPVWIAPLFNKFTALGEGALKDDIFAMAEKVGFRTSGIFVMDGSKRSTHGNAYFTGFGRNKRIVLFDTLIENLGDAGTVAVLAHEMGHQKKNHIKKLLGVSLVIMFAGFWILSLLINYLPFFEAFGFKQTSYHGALIIFSFAAAPVTYFLSPLVSLLSRRFEYQADSFAVAATGNGSDLTEALLALSKKNLSNLTPHPWYSFFHYSHPTLHERLQAIQNTSLSFSGELLSFQALRVNCLLLEPFITKI